jgi:hypothetical protein
VRSLEYHIDEMKVEKEESTSSQTSSRVMVPGGSYSHGYASQHQRHRKRKGTDEIVEEEEEEEDLDGFHQGLAEEDVERRWIGGPPRGREGEDALRSSQWQDFGRHTGGDDAGMEVELMGSDQQKKKMRSVIQKLQVEVKEYHMYRNVVEGALKKLREEVEEKEKKIDSLQKKAKSAESRSWCVYLQPLFPPSLPFFSLNCPLI